MTSLYSSPLCRTFEAFLFTEFSFKISNNQIENEMIAKFKEKKKTSLVLQGDFVRNERFISIIY